MARIIWAPSALGDLEALLSYIGRDAPSTARRFAQRVVDRVSQLATYPFSGARVSEDDSGRYREVLQGNYRIIYRTDGETVFIVRLHHAARLLDASDLR